MKKKRRSIIIYIIILSLILAIPSLICLGIYNNKNVKVIGSENKFKRMISSNGYSSGNILKKIITLPYSLTEIGRYKSNDYDLYDYSTNKGTSSIESNKNISTEEYSTTNLQVENVDEADIVKTDGKYIYSITDDKVVITETLEDGKMKIVSKISNIEIPEEIFLSNNKLIVISTISSNKNTVVDIFDISDKSNPKKLKNVELKLKYYTSRLINDKVYIFSSGNITKNNLDKYYYYDNKNKKHISVYSINDNPEKLDYNKIMYVKGVNTKYLTAIMDIDLNNLEDINFNGIMMNISNAYISQNNIYVAENKYKYDEYKLSSIFKFKGIFGMFSEDSNYGKYTNIYKFNIRNEKIEYVNSAEEKGTTINQFSMDEYNGNLRVALNDGTNQNKIAIFNEKMKKIGGINNIAQGEKIYSTRFINDRAYMVTFKTVDPLFVIDLSDPQNPQILGKLKIPGYSTYLHPYDENHIIGIGNDTKTKVNKNALGKVTSETTTVTGIKMAIFDVTDVNNPKEMFTQKIGDSKTYSSVLSNHKSLLFSKEKNLIAIPINSYNTNISVNVANDNISSSDISSKIKNNRISNGYLVYNIDLNEGFKQKGIITHNADVKYFNYSKYTDELRGLYINNILYTVSNRYIKSNDLDTLQEKSSLNLEEED